MATPHLTEQEAQDLGIPTLILLRELAPPSLDNSISATLDRFRQLEDETGEPLRLGQDFADDMEKVLAMRRPGRGDPWA
jgi:hypothetical protein